MRALGAPDGTVFLSLEFRAQSYQQRSIVEEIKCIIKFCLSDLTTVDYSWHMTQQVKDIVIAFNDCINRRDLEDLAHLMTDDHNFIDSAGGTVTGKTACLKAWAGFFSAFPDYHNQFDRIISNGNKVTIIGNSNCSDARLSGPALWQAILRDNQLVEWRVYEDTPDNRIVLGITN